VCCFYYDKKKNYWFTFPQAIRCTVPGCVCDCFTPGKLHIRFCDACGHGWVPHGKWTNLGFIFFKSHYNISCFYITHYTTSLKHHVVQIAVADWGQTDNGRYELILYIYYILYADTFSSNISHGSFRGSKTLFLLLLFVRVTEVSTGLVIYFQTPFALVVLFFLFFLFIFCFTAKAVYASAFNKTCSLYGGWRGQGLFPGDGAKIDLAKVDPPAPGILLSA